MGSRRRLTAVWVALGTAVLVGLGAAPATAHAYLASSSPADGASLAGAPAVVELRFTEHVVLESTELTVTDAAGRRYAPRKLALVESDEDREAPATVVATLPPLPVGAYHVAWRTLSSDDLHQSSGILAFGVQSAVEAAGPAEARPDALETVGRWGVLAGLGLVLGALLLCGRPLRGLADPGTREQARDGLWRLARLGGVLAAASALVVVLVDVVRFGTGALTTGYAIRWSARELAIVVAVVALVAFRRPGRVPGLPRPAVREAVGGIAAVVAALFTVSLGHFGVRGGVTWVVASTAHLVAAVAWAGAVVCLAVMALRPGRFGLAPALLVPVLKGFRRPAVVAVVVVGVTGLYLASEVVVSVDAALLTAYGRTFLVKLAAAGVVGLLALRTTRAVHRSGRRGTSVAGRRVVAEAVGLSAVVLLGALLASGQPAVAPQLVLHDEPTQIDDRPVADLQQTLLLRPNRPGASVAIVDVLDTRRPSPGPVTGVTVTVAPATADRARLEGPVGTGAPVEASAVTRSRWAAGITVPEQGPVDVTLTIHRRGLADVVDTVRWVVGPTVADERVVVSKAPIAGPLVGASGAVLVLAAVAALVLRRRRRPVQPPTALGPSAVAPEPEPGPDPARRRVPAGRPTGRS